MNRSALGVLACLGMLACSGDDGGSTPDFTLRLTSGDGQTSPAGTTLPLDLVVELSDADGRPGPVTEVVWTAESGGGTLAAATTQTDAMTGRSSNRWTLPPLIEEPWYLTATIAGEAPVQFTGVPLPGNHPLTEIRVVNERPIAGITVTVHGPYSRPRRLDVPDRDNQPVSTTLPVEQGDAITLTGELGGTQFDQTTCTVGRRMIPDPAEPTFGSGLAIVLSSDLQHPTEVACAANWVETGPP